MVPPVCNPVHVQSLVTVSTSLHGKGTPSTVWFAWVCVSYYVNCLFTSVVRQQNVVFSSATLFMVSRRGLAPCVWHWLVLFSVPRYTDPIHPHFSHYKFLIRRPHLLTTQILLAPLLCLGRQELETSSGGSLLCPHALFTGTHSAD